MYFEELKKVIDNYA